MATISYDENGNMKSVMMTCEEYQEYLELKSEKNLPEIKRIVGEEIISLIREYLKDKSSEKLIPELEKEPDAELESESEECDKDTTSLEDEKDNDPVVTEDKSSSDDSVNIPPPHVIETKAPVDKIQIIRFKGTQNARGYYKGYKKFCVIKGSKANGETSNTFKSEKFRFAKELRDKLISDGILAREDDWGDYEFTQDYEFTSVSTAAYIVAGTPKSGTDLWGPPPKN